MDNRKFSIALIFLVLCSFQLSFATTNDNEQAPQEDSKPIKGTLKNSAKALLLVDFAKLHHLK